MVYQFLFPRNQTHDLAVVSTMLYQLISKKKCIRGKEKYKKSSKYKDSCTCGKQPLTYKTNSEQNWSFNVANHILSTYLFKIMFL